MRKGLSYTGRKAELLARVCSQLQKDQQQESYIKYEGGCTEDPKAAI